MPGPAVVFDRVWKKFRRGERHDSLRDLIPAMVRGALGRSRGTELEDREFWALQDVSFQVESGEALGIIGANGAGKSTALKLLTRILRPTRGTCGVRGRVGALIEVAAGFHQDLTGRENVYLQGSIMGMKRAEIGRKLEEIVEFAGVGEFMDTPVKRYSNGMNARLGFSIAAHLDPDVLIIDEVLSVGDIAFQEKCFRRMESFLQRGTAIVLVSHNLHAVSQLCRRAILLDHGAPVLAGDPLDVIAAYSRHAGEAGSLVEGPGATVRVAASAGEPPRQDWRLEPGDTLSLSIDVTLKQRVRRATVGIVVWDVARNLYVYGATSDALGIRALEGEPGATMKYSFAFDANLARGVYTVEVNVFDVDRQEHLAVLRPAAQFAVVESVTHQGIANLYLRGSEHGVPMET